MYLLDTNVLSELRKLGDGRCAPAVAAWIAGVDQLDLHLSVVTLMEIELGIVRLERRDERQAAMLRRWMRDRVMPTFAATILPIDAAVAIRCARLHVSDPASERDAWIAATGLVHGLTIVSRDIADFAKTGAVLLDPFTVA
ncbi:MAG TPA: type II toxin-antitoxin system VapC family toxin [Sphingomonas sp.]|jgi:hypothetical protein